MKKFLFDLFPLILFFAAYKFAGIYVATGVAMAAAILQILWIKLRGHPVETMHWVNLSIIVVFGGATLWLQNEAFIKWKPTALYWLFGGVLLGSKLFTGRNLMQKLLGEKNRHARQRMDTPEFGLGAFLSCGRWPEPVCCLFRLVH